MTEERIWARHGPSQSMWITDTKGVGVHAHFYIPRDEFHVDLDCASMRATATLDRYMATQLRDALTSLLDHRVEAPTQQFEETQ